MITYELALKLKDAGFLQEDKDIGTLAYCNKVDCCGNDLHLIHHDNDEGGIVGNDYSHRFVDGWSDEEEKWNSDFVKCPTLSELIEACGKEGKESADYGDDGNFILWWSGKDWRAGYYSLGSENYIDDYPRNEFGSTPEEAVANLWLTLKGK